MVIRIDLDLDLIKKYLTKISLAKFVGLSFIFSLIIFIVIPGIINDISKNIDIEENAIEYLKLTHGSSNSFFCVKHFCSSYVDDINNIGYKKQVFFYCSDKINIIEKPCGLINKE